MYLKNAQQYGDWRFFMVAPDGKEIVVPNTGRAGNLFQLTEIVKQQITQFDKVTNYSEKPKEEAKALGYDWFTYLKKTVEHQICLRSAEGLCWNDGVGDKLHGFSKEIDKKIDKLPSKIQRVAQSGVKILTKLATGESKPRLGGCRTCGGRRTFSPEGNNLGRAGKLNRAGKK